MKITIYSKDGYQIRFVDWRKVQSGVEIDLDVTDPDGNKFEVKEVKMGGHIEGWLMMLSRIEGRSWQDAVKDWLAPKVALIPSFLLKDGFDTLKGLVEMAKAGRKEEE